MKALLGWLAIALASFALLATATHLARSSRPEKVLVALDTSYDMSLAGSGLNRALASLEARYAQFAFVDSMTVLRGWEESPELSSKPSFFGDPDYPALAASADRRAAELGATRVVFLVAKGDSPALSGREVRVAR